MTVTNASPYQRGYAQRPCTSNQRGYVLNLLRKLKLPIDFCTQDHQYTLGRLHSFAPGKRIDDVLTELAAVRCSQLIDQLKGLVDNGKSD